MTFAAPCLQLDHFDVPRACIVLRPRENTASSFASKMRGRSCHSSTSFHSRCTLHRHARPSASNLLVPPPMQRSQLSDRLTLGRPVARQSVLATANAFSPSYHDWPNAVTLCDARYHHASWPRQVIAMLKSKINHNNTCTCSSWCIDNISEAGGLQTHSKM